MAKDMVNKPDHFNVGGIETIELLEAFLTREEFEGYCKGTLLAYRLRAPYKGNAEQDYDKSLWYWDLFRNHGCDVESFLESEGKRRM